MASSELAPTVSLAQTTDDRLYEIFHPVAKKRADKHKVTGNKFAHYTSADTGLKILRSKQIWMRNTACMSDYREVRHGKGLLKQYFDDSERRKNFISTFDKFAVGAAKEALDRFFQWCSSDRETTFIACLTEHPCQIKRSCDDEDIVNLEKQYGRLSMWRAFGIGPSVAIVFDGNKFDSLPTISLSPVAYLDLDGVCKAIARVLKCVEGEIDFLKSQPPESITDRLHTALYYGALCLKHPAFHEEMEWRVIFDAGHPMPSFMEREEVSIGGVPQTIYKLSIDLKNWLDQILIGPTQFPDPIKDALTTELKKIGVHDYSKKIDRTNIPIRTNS